VLRRIQVESAGIPHVLRTMLAEEGEMRPAGFWGIYSVLAGIDGLAVTQMKPGMKAYIESSKIPEMLLYEVANQNPFAADAAAPVWEDVFMDKSPLSNEAERMLTEGLTQSAFFGVCNQAFLQTMKLPAEWEIIKPFAASALSLSSDDPRLADTMRSTLINSASSMSEFYKAALKDDTFRKAWLDRMVVMCKFLGKSAPVASAIRGRQDTLNDWKRIVADRAATDTTMMQSIVESLSARRVGDPNWARAVKKVRRGLAKMMFGDRIMFEQILADKNGDYKKDLLAAVRTFFGTYVEQAWAQE